MNGETNPRERLALVSTRIGVLAGLLKELSPVADLDTYGVVFGRRLRDEAELRELGVRILELRP